MNNINNNQENNPKTDDSVVLNVLEKIKTGQVKMHSKVHFALRFVLFAVLVAIVLLTSVLILSYLLFSIRISGGLFLLGFGSHGLFLFFALFPWKSLILNILCLLALDVLVKKFRFGYQYPMVYVISGSIAVILLAGFVINVTPLHQFLLSGPSIVSCRFLAVFTRHSGNRLESKEFSEVLSKRSAPARLL